MKSYTITVNGTAYEVTVEETGSVSAPAAAPKAAPKAAPAAAPKAACLLYTSSTGTDASIWIERTDGDRRYRRTLSDYCYRQREC